MTVDKVAVRSLGQKPVCGLRSQETKKGHCNNGKSGAGKRLGTHADKSVTDSLR